MIRRRPPGGAARFAYDVFGRRISKIVGGALTQYAYDGANIAQEVTGPATSAYLRAPWVDEPLSRGGQEFYLLGGPGSVVALTDAAGGVTTAYSYAPFGAVSREGAPSGNPFEYAGRENDGTGFYYYRARYYSPALGRFLSEDPIGFTAGDPNLYAYVANSPVQLSDPTGLAVEGIVWWGNSRSGFEGPRYGNWVGAQLVGRSGAGPTWPARAPGGQYRRVRHEP